MSDSEQELYDIFRTELEELLDSLGSCLEEMDDSSVDVVAGASAAMMVAQSIKGAARVTGFGAIVEVAHAIEDVLSGVKHGAEAPSAGLLSKLREGVTLLELLATGRAEEESAAYAALLRSVADSQEETTTAERPTKKTATNASKGRAKARPARRRNSMPRRQKSHSDAVAAESRRAANGKSPVPASVTSRGKARVDSREASVRVAVDRLDRMMATTSEFLTVHTRQEARSQSLDELVDDIRVLRRSLPQEALVGFDRFVKNLEGIFQSSRRDLRQLGYLTDEVRDAMRTVRMMPLSAMLPQWRRLVREASKAAGRQVLLVNELGDVELDRRVLEAIRDPMVHLLRNAVGHGIEPEEERVAASKPPRGTVELRAIVRGPSVHLEVSDDGRGIDSRVVVEKAVRLGCVSRRVADGLGSDGVRELLFEPGLTTTEVADELSGRGIGLDIVRQGVRTLGGDVEIAAEPRRGGTTFVLKLPVSLVSTRGLLVETRGVVFALPIEHVERSIWVKASEARKIDGGTAIKIGSGEPLRLRWLSSLMGLKRDPDPELLRVVVLDCAGRRLGLVVDEIIGQQDFVSKSLPWNLKRIDAVSGAFILADGAVSPVVDLAAVLRRGVERRGETVFDEPEAHQARVLVADDSLTSRTLERNILRAAGYDVETCDDGVAAWERLQESSIDVLVTDIEMPGIDGLELTRRVRADDKLKNLPVIVVSSRGSDADLAHGAEVGADEYIVKGKFNQSRLLEAVARLV